MSLDWVRPFCLALPQVTEHVQWEIDLVFKIGGKMFATLVLEPYSHSVSLKCSPEVFSELVERPGIIPAPYLARAHWVALESPDAITRPELEKLLREGYEMVLAKVPKKLRVELNKPATRKARKSRL